MGEACNTKLVSRPLQMPTEASPLDPWAVLASSTLTVLLTVLAPSFSSPSIQFSGYVGWVFGLLFGLAARKHGGSSTHAKVSTLAPAVAAIACIVANEWVMLLGACMYAPPNILSWPCGQVVPTIHHQTFIIAQGL